MLPNRFYFLAAVVFSAQLTLQERVVVHRVHGRAVGGIMSSTLAFMKTLGTSRTARKRHSCSNPSFCCPGCRWNFSRTAVR
jgi:hypothetical protein